MPSFVQHSLVLLGRYMRVYAATIQVDLLRLYHVAVLHSVPLLFSDATKIIQLRKRESGILLNSSNHYHRHLSLVPGFYLLLDEIPLFRDLSRTRRIKLRNQANPY